MTLSFPFVRNTFLILVVLVSAASAQAQSPAEDNLDAVVYSPAARKALAAEKEAGLPQVDLVEVGPKRREQPGSKGTLDSRILESVLGVDPIPALSRTLDHYTTPLAKRETYTPWSEIKNLPSAAEKYVSPQESICGGDGRRRVSNTHRFPWRMNCMLIITNADGSKSYGTGWLVGPRTVITSGHVVHDGKGGKWAKKIEVIPGMNGSRRPYGTYVSRKFSTKTGWTRYSKQAFDYGAIFLSTDLGNRLGYYGFRNESTRTLSTMSVNTAGYPGDKPRGQQWRGYGRISKVSSTMLYYHIDTYGGQSGSCVYRLTRGNRYAVGIHGYGGCPNKAVRIRTSVYNDLLRWRQGR